MRKVRMAIFCYEPFVEMLSDDVESAELTIEQLVSHILLEFFEEVAIDDIHIVPPSDAQQESSVVIRARCESMSAPFLAFDEQFLELTLEGSISCALVELLGTIGIDEVTIK